MILFHFKFFNYIGPLTFFSQKFKMKTNLLFSELYNRMRRISKIVLFFLYEKQGHKLWRSLSLTFYFPRLIIHFLTRRCKNYWKRKVTLQKQSFLLSLSFSLSPSLSYTHTNILFSISLSLSLSHTPHTHTQTRIHTHVETLRQKDVQSCSTQSLAHIKHWRNFVEDLCYVYFHILYDKTLFENRIS